MFERFTNRARTAVKLADAEARALGRSEVGPEHLLLGTLADRDCLASKVLRGEGIDRSAVLRALAPSVDRDAEVLRAIGIDLDAVRRRAEEVFGPGALDRPPPGSSGPTRSGRSGLFSTRRRGNVAGHIPLGTAAKAVLAESVHAAVEIGDNYIGTEHLLIGILADADSTAARALHHLGLTLDRAALRARISEELGRAA